MKVNQLKIKRFNKIDKSWFCRKKLRIGVNYADCYKLNYTNYLKICTMLQSTKRYRILCFNNSLINKIYVKLYDAST